MKIEIRLFRLFCRLFGEPKNYDSVKFRRYFNNGFRITYVLLTKKEKKTNSFKKWRQDLNLWETKKSIGYVYSIFKDGKTKHEYSILRK